MSSSALRWFKLMEVLGSGFFVGPGVAQSWDYVDRLMVQEVLWMRGPAPTRQVVADGRKAATFAASAPLASGRLPAAFSVAAA